MHSFIILLFYTGRPTSLIIDFSARATRIIPIIDGYTLNKAIVSTSRGGNWIDVEVKNEIDKSGNADIYYLFFYLFISFYSYYTLFIISFYFDSVLILIHYTISNFIILLLQYFPPL